jgi:hypothetical protein
MKLIEFMKAGMTYSYAESAYMTHVNKAVWCGGKLHLPPSVVRLMRGATEDEMALIARSLDVVMIDPPPGYAMLLGPYCPPKMPPAPTP